MTPTSTAVVWADPQREAAFGAWLAPLAAQHGLRTETLRPASADASFRRYLRIDAQAGNSLIVMDAPPAQENCEPFVRIAGLMHEAGLRVPQILAWDEPQGFMLLDDLGHQTLLDVILPEQPAANLPAYLAATESLLAWQTASRPGVLPAYDEALLRRELQLFPDWYLAQHKGLTLSAAQQQVLHKAFDLIVQRVLANEAGPARDIVLLASRGHLLLAPDNGLLAPVKQSDAAAVAWRLTAQGMIRCGIGRASATFHGRDIFAPLAAELAAGRLTPDQVGEPIAELVPSWLDDPLVTEDRITGAIVTIDHFGNLITNIDKTLYDLPRHPKCQIRLLSRFNFTRITFLFS